MADNCGLDCTLYLTVSCAHARLFALLVSAMKNCFWNKPNAEQVPSLHLCAGPAPALFCTGLDTGMVLDVGQSEAHVVAVYRGANLTSSYACECARSSECCRRKNNVSVCLSCSCRNGSGSGSVPFVRSVCVYAFRVQVFSL